MFGCQAPDTGNAEIIAHYGTPEQKERYLQPLLDGEMFSLLLDDRAARRRRPDACSRPRAVKDGDEWVINGWKYFSSNAKTASFLIVMAVTDPEVSAYQGMSMFLVPTDTPGVKIVRNVGLYGEPMNEGFHALIHYDDVRVPDGRAARRRGPGVRDRADPPRRRPHPPRHAHHRPGAEGDRHDVRAGAEPRDRRAALLADKQFVQGYIADSYAQLVQFRLFVLYTAWEIDKYNDYKRVRKDIATAKVVMPTVLHDIAWRAMQVHGALGTTNEMPFFQMIHGAGVMGLADGPTEVHKVTVARQVLRDYKATDDMWPTEWIPEEARRRQGEVRRVPRARSGEPVIDFDRLAAWMDDERPARQGRAARAALHLRRHAERDLRAAPRRPALRHPHPAAGRAGRPRRAASCASGASSRRSTAPTSRTPPAIAVCEDPSVLGRAFYLMGFVDGWSPMGIATRSGRRRSTPTSRRARGSATSSPRASRCSPRSTGRPRASRTSAAPTASTSARSTAGRAFFERIKGRELAGHRRRVGVAARAPADRLHPGLMHGDYQFANVMYKDGAPAKLAALVDWEMGTVGDPKLDLGWMVQSWPEDTQRAGGVGGELRRHAGHAVARPGARALRRGVGPPGRRHRLLRHPRQVEARDRARAGLPARRRRREAARVRPDRARPHEGRGRPRRDHRLPGRRADVRAAVCPEYGPPEVVRVEDVPVADRSARARSACGSTRRR